MDFGEWYLSALTTAIAILFSLCLFLLKDVYANFKKSQSDNIFRIKELERELAKNTEEITVFKNKTVLELGNIKDRLGLLSDLSRELSSVNINFVRLEEKVRVINLKFESDLGKVIRKD